MFKAFITNLGKYNEGELVGEWLDFPCDEEEWEDCLNKIGIGSTDDFGQPYEEYFVTDYESDIIPVDTLLNDIGEYASYEELNEYGEKSEELENLDGAFGEGFVYSLIKEVGDIDEVLDNLDNMIVIAADNIYDKYEDIGYYYADIVELDREVLEDHFDFERFGRDLTFESWENTEFDPDDPESEEYISASEAICGYEGASDKTIGETYVYDVIGGVDELDKDTLERYFDFEGFGRDIYLSGDFHGVKTDNHEYYWVEFF